jgi:hypothetical protein
MNTRTYDRTRWDRTQATLLVGFFAVVGGVPSTIVLAVATGIVRLGGAS